MTTQQKDFQAPVKYDPPDVVLAKLGFNDDASRAFIYAEAAIMKVDSGLLDIPENIAEVVKAAQYTRDYGFMPGIHLHMQPFRSKAKRKLPNGATVDVWEDRVSLVVGEQAYKAAARIQANKEGDHLEFEWEPLTDDEIRRYVAENMPKNFELTDEDRGVRARVLSYKGAQIATAMGRKYDPEWAYGFCFMKGVPKVNDRGEKSYPKSDRDRIPSQRVALDVAIRRATKSAIMQKYHLIPLGEGTEEQRISQIVRQAAPDQRNEWPARDVRLRTEDDGDVFFYGEERPGDTVVDGEATQVASEAPSDSAGNQPSDSGTHGEAKPAANGNLAGLPAGNGFIRPGQITRVQLNTIHALGVALCTDQATWDTKRPAHVKRVSGGRTESSAELWQAEGDKLITFLETKIRQEYERIAQPHVDAGNVEALVDSDSLHGVELANALKALRKEPAPSAKADNPFEREVAAA